MDYIRILQFEEWRKNNDKTGSGLNRYNTTGLNERLSVEVSRVTHDGGLFNQRIIGGKKKIKKSKKAKKLDGVVIKGSRASIIRVFEF
jgi:hypothetical protein